MARTIASPVGELKLVASENGLAAILWKNDRSDRVRLGNLVKDDSHPLLQRVAAQLGEYFAGRRKRFDIPLDIAGTDFQRRAWAALMTIPYGATRTYGTLAREVGNEAASRAFGAACGRNPVSIIVPCHRAVASTGALTGFAGGLATKRFLLELESRCATVAA